MIYGSADVPKSGGQNLILIRADRSPPCSIANIGTTSKKSSRVFPDSFEPGTYIPSTRFFHVQDKKTLMTSITQGLVKLSSGDPRSRRNINTRANISVNQRRNLPSASAIPLLTRLATTEIPNKPNKPPAPILVG